MLLPRQSNRKSYEEANGSVRVFEACEKVRLRSLEGADQLRVADYARAGDGRAGAAWRGAMDRGLVDIGEGLRLHEKVVVENKNV